MGMVGEWHVCNGFRYLHAQGNAFVNLESHAISTHLLLGSNLGKQWSLEHLCQPLLDSYIARSVLLSHSSRDGC
jgi:hypothetical protein